MKRKEFIRIVHKAMERIYWNNNYSCHELQMAQGFRAGEETNATVYLDYTRVFAATTWFEEIPIDFGEDTYFGVQQARLNALAMYLAQSLTFKTYKEL